MFDKHENSVGNSKRNDPDRVEQQDQTQNVGTQKTSDHQTGTNNCGFQNMNQQLKNILQYSKLLKHIHRIAEEKEIHTPPVQESSFKIKWNK